MVKKRLYDNENDRYIDATIKLDLETTRALRPIFDRCTKAGYSYRDISHVMMQAVFGLEMEAILTQQVEKAKINKT